MKKSLSFTSLYLLTAFLVLFANIQGLLYNCFNAVDFGIYLQGVYGLTQGDLNPYLSVRDLKLFTDHFDPVTFFPAILMKATVIHPTVLMGFEWAVLMALSLVVFFKAKKILPLYYALFLTMIVFVNKPVLLALRFPVHPTTWSVIPLFFLSYSLFKNQTKAVFLWGLSLFFFKESYPFALLSLSFYYFFKNERKTFYLFFFSSVLGLFLLFKVRPMLLGETYGHAGLLFQRADQGHLSFIVTVIKEFKYFDLLKNFLPFFFILGLYLKLEKKDFSLSHPFIGLCFFIAPLFAMQFLANRFDFHYGSTFVALLLPLFFQDKISQFLLSKEKWLITLCLVFVFNAGSELEKMIGQLFFSKNRQCVISPEKKQSLKNLLEKTRALTASDQLVLTGGAFNRVLRPGLSLYQIRGFSKIPENFNWLLLEVHPKEQSWPLSPEEIQSFLKICGPLSKEVVYQDSFFYLAKGDFKKECLK